MRSTKALSRARIASSTTSLRSRLGVKRSLPSVGNGHGVAEDCAEAFLEDRVLALGLGDFFLARVVVQVVLEGGVHNEAGSDRVQVLPLHPLVFDLL